MQGTLVLLLVSLFLRTIQFTASGANDLPVFAYFNYDVETFHRLTSHKISSVVVRSMKDCGMACLGHCECLSFNLGNTASNGRKECELIRTDKYNSNSTYNSSHDFHHFFIKNPCGSGKTVCKNGGTCYTKDTSYQCMCPKGYYGRHCENTGITQAKSCLEWLQHGYNKSGVYKMDTNGGLLPAAYYCDMTTDGGGWVVLLRRTENGTEDFDRSRDQYKLFFGDLLGEFWFGLAYMSRLTRAENYELRVDLEDWEGNTTYAKYSVFEVTGSEDFRLTIGGYSGTAGDSFSFANGMNFTTKDSDHDERSDGNCAVLSKAGWWFKKCFKALLTGNGIIWPTWKGFGYSLKSCEMKIRALGN